MPSETTLRTGAAARELGVHPDTLRGWADKGLITHQRTPKGRIYFLRADLDAFIAQHRHEAEA